MTNDQKLDQLLEESGEIRAWQIRHEASHTMIERDVGNHGAELYGNGKPGLKSSVQSLREQLDRVMRRSPLAASFQRVAENVSAGSILMFIAWMLFLWKSVPTP